MGRRIWNTAPLCGGNLPSVHKLKVRVKRLITTQLLLCAAVVHAADSAPTFTTTTTYLSAHALASRLSCFLWSTLPDAELFALANSGKLKEPAVLKAQVARLLADPRADRFADSFTDQWLALNTLGTTPPDAKRKGYRIYYRGKLEPAMREETHQYFRHVLRENRSVRDFIESDYDPIATAPSTRRIRPSAPWANTRASPSKTSQV